MFQENSCAGRTAPATLRRAECPPPILTLKISEGPVHYGETKRVDALSNILKGAMRRSGSHDRELIEQSLDGSERAFRRLVEKHHALVFSVVRGIMGQRDEVEDVVQEVFIKIYRNLSGYRGDSRFSTWIYRIARNEALNARSRFRPRTEPIDESSTLASSEAGPEERIERERAKRLLEDLLAALDDQQRIAIELRYLGEKSYAEIADIMDIPIGTVKTHIHRGKAAMKRMLSTNRPERNRYEL